MHQPALTLIALLYWVKFTIFAAIIAAAHARLQAYIPLRGGMDMVAVFNAVRKEQHPCFMQLGQFEGYVLASRASNMSFLRCCRAYSASTTGLQWA